MSPSSPALALVTGTSSGIGEALARDLLTRGWQVVGVARRPVAIPGPAYTHLQLDVADLAALQSALDDQVAPLIRNPAVTRLGLVNNAAMEALLGTIGRIDANALLKVYTVNTAAPILLMGWFQRHARTGQALRIVNVSTGAAVKPLPGLAAYGSTKAALRMAGMIWAAELDAAQPAASMPTDASLLSYEPGVVDTPMQAAIRRSSTDTLPGVQRFRDFATNGALAPPALPAREIAEYLESERQPRWDERRFHPAGS